MLRTDASKSIDIGHGYRDGFVVPPAATVVPQPKPNPRPVEDDDDEHFDHRADMGDMDGLDDEPGEDDDDTDEDGCDEDEDALPVAASGQPWYRAQWCPKYDAVFAQVPAGA